MSGAERGAFLGRSIERVEDLSILRGDGRYIDDLPVPANVRHAAFLRAPIAHGRIAAIATSRAAAHPRVEAVLTGADLAAVTAPFITGVKTDARQYAVAVDRVRYAGEPVAIVIASDRYVAEDALDLVRVDYEPLPAVVDPEAAARPDAPLLHEGAGANVLHERAFRYGDPEAAFATAAQVVEITTRYPRNSCTPIETLGAIAAFRPGDGAYEVTANFQGPYTLHAVMARALNVPGARLRLRTPPDSGGSYGVKQAVFPYIVALAAAARLTGFPVKWIEDRLEHLAAATSATNRVTTLKGAFDAEGRLLALDWDQLDDCGAYLRAPEPATLYRMHGNMTGAYAVEHLSIRNRVVVTNKTPSGLMRGFGGPQVYFPLERLMDVAARRLGLDPLDIRRRNLVPASAMPYRTASGALLDSGDYARAVERAAREGGLDALHATREATRAEGRLYGIGFACVVEPSISNMGYITTLLSPAERERAGPKDGALATATVAFDPTGAVTVSAASVPQGQGHRTVLAQVVADALGLDPAGITVASDHDTAKDAWSIASGNYSSRFAGAVAGAAHLAAMRLRERLAEIAAAGLNVRPEEVEFAGGKAFARGNPENAVPIGRTAARAHWSPLSLPDGAGAGLRETVFWTLPELAAPDAADRVNSSGAYGFVFDICAVEIDRDTGAVRIDRYVTMHDAGRLLHPALADGQIRGGFAHGLGAALLEELAYDDGGNFLAGSFADYLPPTAVETPPLTILHEESLSPFTPLGAKGLGEGNAMSTPVAIANAVADAIGVEVTTLPLTRSRVTALLAGEEPEPPGPAPAMPALAPPPGEGHALTGAGSEIVAAPREDVWMTLMSEDALAHVVPGVRSLERIGRSAYRASVVLGVGPVKGRFDAGLEMLDLDAPSSLRLRGSATGPLGASRGEAIVRLAEAEGGTRVEYAYAVRISGKVAQVGGRLIEGAARSLIGEAFARLVRHTAPEPTPRPSFWRRLLAILRGRG